MAPEFELRGRSATPALRPFVAELVGYAYSGDPPALHRGLPSQFLTVVISLDEPLGVAWPGAPVDKFDMLISGLHSRAVAIGDSPNRSGIQLALTPAGARALFGVPAGELGSIVVDLDALLGRPAKQLADQLQAIPAWEQRFDRIEGLLLEQDPGRVSDGLRPELGWAWRRLRESAGAISVQELAQEVGWSRRHLTDRFSQEFGLAPKVAARVLRFERAVVRLKRKPRTKLADLAADLGYADQAHLTREWHALAGCSPRQWMIEELPFVQDDQAGTEHSGRHEH
ncbi:AraC family transcriptional regulator [Kribbella deserti]|uniref:Helix-turn-helix domain-containing protein n=1 Tax=Kribbella deserti TaxID=1926257 RepID=A0ABV6QXA5_9ACTN